MRYGEKEIKEFDVEKDLELWENKQENDYLIKITLPEFACLCPRSGYPDFATLYLEYMPDALVVELKAIKLYINSFMYRHISHEASINEIYNTLKNKLKPKYIKLVGDFNPRGNVHTVIECRSDLSAQDFEAEGASLNLKRLKAKNSAAPLNKTSKISKLAANKGSKSVKTASKAVKTSSKAKRA